MKALVDYICESHDPNSKSSLFELTKNNLLDACKLLCLLGPSALVKKVKFVSDSFKINLANLTGKFRNINKQRTVKKSLLLTLPIWPVPSPDEKREG
ncbi:hypothetical protein BpHYR1_009447 [Brachionus plicatilis]|uniref:Uncharacterized protein n=1 Tax=Brachionus plicatilis TaxID=10195 RepID=A0A3M7P8U1_BRAPC|nr:hypothetical protein BpHYR1_009447 [Brachionus plicatilis]